MICDKVKECVEKARHMVPEEPKKKKKGANPHNARQNSQAIYQYPLCEPPCRNAACQKACIAFLDRRSRPKCEEKGKSYVLDQSELFPHFEVIQLHIDKGVISDPEASSVNKCDYALLIRDSASSGEKNGTAILVELKGVEVRHALKQLLASLTQNELQPLWNSQRRIYGRVVCKSSPPRIQNTDEFMDAKEAFLLRRGNLKIFEENRIEEYKCLDQMS